MTLAAQVQDLLARRRSRAWRRLRWAAGITVLVGWSLGAIVLGDADWSRVGAGRGLRLLWAFDPGVLAGLAAPALDSVLIALLGTVLGALLAAPVAVLGIRRGPGGRAGYLLGRGLMVLSRSVHEVMWGLLFVAAVGLGALPGILALAVRSVGFLAKSTAEAVEDLPPAALDGLRAAGAGPLQCLRHGLLPCLLPQWLGFVLFELEVNVRRATVVGLVGAGGLGLALQRQFAAYNWGGVVAVLSVVLALVAVAEGVSALGRRALR